MTQAKALKQYRLDLSRNISGILSFLCRHFFKSERAFPSQC